MAAAPLTDAELAAQFRILMRRYGGSTPEAFIGVLCPLLVPVKSIDKRVLKIAGQGHWRASFKMDITPVNRHLIQIGRTGKFVPATYQTGAASWREIAKGRIIGCDRKKNVAEGEIYVGGSKTELTEALALLENDSLLEIDQFGAAAKVLSGLAEFYLCENVSAAGYNVLRMPEDMAKHLGFYANYDLEVEKGGVAKKLEVKSLWGTNTRYARLIHSTTTAPKGDSSTWTPEQKKNHYPTSSCKYTTGLGSARWMKCGTWLSPQSDGWHCRRAFDLCATGRARA